MELRIQKLRRHTGDFPSSTIQIKIQIQVDNCSDQLYGLYFFCTNVLFVVYMKSVGDNFLFDPPEGHNYFVEYISKAYQALTDPTSRANFEK